MGTPPSFSAMFSKGDNFRDFLFAYLEDEILSKLVLLLKERICSDGKENYFLYKMTPIYMGGNNANDRVSSPESVPIYLRNKRLYRLSLLSKAWAVLKVFFSSR